MATLSQRLRQQRTPGYGYSTPIGGNGYNLPVVQPGQTDANQVTGAQRALDAPAGPEEDPQYLAFMRALGMEEDNLRSDVSRQKEQARQRLMDALPGFETSRSRGMEDIDYGHAGRGTWSSSARLQDENRWNSEIDTRKTTLQNDTTRQEGDLEAMLTRTLAQNQANTAEEAMMAIDRVKGARAQMLADTKATADSNATSRSEAGLASGLSQGYSESTLRSLANNATRRRLLSTSPRSLY